MNFQDKKAIITGAAGNIGREIALELSRRGATIFITDLDEGKLKTISQESEREIYFRAANVKQQQQVKAAIAQALKKMGRVDILVNVAGVVGQQPYDHITTEDWNSIFDVNVRGTFYFIQEIGPLMSKQKKGKIVNFSSKSGKTGSALMCHYSAAKAAVIGLTQALAYELAPYNINVNAICPGITDKTGVWSKVCADYMDNLELSREEVVQKFAAKVPLGRLASITDIVRVVLFLCSEYSDYMTGQAINVSGGREMH